MGAKPDALMYVGEGKGQLELGATGKLTNIDRFKTILVTFFFSFYINESSDVIGPHSFSPKVVL